MLILLEGAVLHRGLPARHPQALCRAGNLPRPQPPLHQKGPAAQGNCRPYFCPDRRCGSAAAQRCGGLLGRISGQLSDLAHRGLVRRAGAGLPVVLPLQSRPHPRHRRDGGILRLPLSPPPVLHRDAARAPRLRGGRGAGGPARNDSTFWRPPFWRWR